MAGGNTLCRPEGEVEKCADKDADADVDPKHNLHGVDKPRTGPGDAILADGDEYSSRAAAVRIVEYSGGYRGIETYETILWQVSFSSLFRGRREAHTQEEMNRDSI